MKRSFTALALLLMLAIVPVFSGCATDPATGQSSFVAPKSATQTVYALEVSLTTATNALADLHNAGVVTGDNYAKAFAIQKQAVATLMLARNAATAKAGDKLQVYLTTLSGLIDQIAIYNGGKK